MDTHKRGSICYGHISSATGHVNDKQLATDRASQLAILVQIRTAFASLPSLGGALHGIRRIRHGGKGRRTSLFPSRKNEASLALESRLELAHALQLERDPHVQKYRAQAIQIALPHGFHAVPDFLVQTTAGDFEVHEVKPSIEHLSTDELARFQTIEEVLNSVSVRFRLIDHRSLPNEVELCRLLQLYARGHVHNFTPLQVKLARQLLIKTTPKCLLDAHTMLINAELPSMLAEHLIFHKVIELPTHPGAVSW